MANADTAIVIGYDDDDENNVIDMDVSSTAGNASTTPAPPSSPISRVVSSVSPVADIDARAEPEADRELTTTLMPTPESSPSKDTSSISEICPALETKGAPLVSAEYGQNSPKGGNKSPPGAPRKMARRASSSLFDATGGGGNDNQEKDGTDKDEKVVESARKRLDFDDKDTLPTPNQMEGECHEANTDANAASSSSSQPQLECNETLASGKLPDSICVTTVSRPPATQ